MLIRAVRKRVRIVLDPAGYWRIVSVGRLHYAELRKTVKEIGADLLSDVPADRVIRPRQRLGPRKTAVDLNVLRRRRPRHNPRERADGDQRDRNFRGHSHGEERLRVLTGELCETRSALSSWSYAGIRPSLFRHTTGRRRLAVLGTSGLPSYSYAWETRGREGERPTKRDPVGPLV